MRATQMAPITGLRPVAPTLIQIRNLKKTYAAGRVQALSNINLDIADGEFVCVVGPSGCGKSTLLRILAGLDDYDSGQVMLGTKTVSGPSRDVGVVFQQANLLPWLTVRENVALPLRVGGGRPDGADDVDRLLEVAGLKDFGGRYPYELSGGMQQRAGICRALVRNPRILLMDEPFGALDALTRERMNLELQRIWQSTGKTVMLITHSISEAIFLADRVIVMSARPGRVLRELTVDIPRPRSNDTIISHPDYPALAKEIRALLTGQGEE
ncbi:NitT/TauT family transport system ATP-binding protein [Azospirillum brasilense]|nr:ABC transporter ATP-binding protein [Azospirillum baldaniorum]TWA78257.1 NitT/TauT family transport system ATP-binding protein [Azospirillum brasilense]